MFRELFIATISCGVFLLLDAGAARADTPKGRSDLIDHYLDEMNGTPPLYQSAPVTHIVPQFNTISYSLSLDYQSLEVTPDPAAPGAEDFDESLSLGGYEVSPYIALSLKRVGLGFSVEAGHKEAVWSQTFQRDPNNAQYQKSSLDYRGVGIYFYYIPFVSRGGRFVPTIMIGGRSQTAKHKVSYVAFGEEAASKAPQETDTYNYNVVTYQVGLNLGFRLFKNFTIIPWADYASPDTSAAEALATSTSSSQRTTDLLAEDIDLFWRDTRPLNYGLDFALHFGSFEVHVGGVLGMLLASGTGSDRIADDSVSVSVSFSQKGK